MSVGPHLLGALQKQMPSFELLFAHSVGFKKVDLLSASSTFQDTLENPEFGCIELRRRIKVAIPGQGQSDGQMSVIVHMWAYEGTEVVHWAVIPILDDTKNPCGAINAEVMLKVEHPDGFTALRYSLPHGIAPYGEEGYHRLPTNHMADFTGRPFTGVIGFGETRQDQYAAAEDSLLNPTWLGDHVEFDLPLKQDRNYVRSLVAKEEADARRWQTTYNANAWDMFGHSAHTGSAGDQFRFGTNRLAAISSGRSQKVADYYRGMLLRVEFLRPGWLDWTQIDLTLPGNHPKSVHMFYSARHHSSKNETGRANWGGTEQGDNRGINFYNIEHTTTLLITLAWYLKCPLLRDMALYQAMTVFTQWGTIPWPEGYYNGGGRSNYTREHERPARKAAQGEMLAELHSTYLPGAAQLRAALENLLKDKHELAISEWRDATDSKGRPMPWGGTAMPFSRPDGRLSADELKGTPFEGEEPKRVSLKAGWQCGLGVAGVLPWALKTQHVATLSKLRDQLHLVVQSAQQRGGSWYLPKYFNTEYPQVGGRYSMVRLNQQIEKWLLPLLAIRIFDDRGVDGTAREGLYQAVLAGHPDNPHGQWSADPEGITSLARMMNFDNVTLLPIPETIKPLPTI